MNSNKILSYVLLNNIMNTVLNITVYQLVKGAAVLFILSKSMCSDREQTCNFPLGPMGPACSTVIVPYNSRWPTEMALHSQTTLV